MDVFTKGLCENDFVFYHSPFDPPIGLFPKQQTEK